MSKLVTVIVGLVGILIAGVLYRIGVPGFISADVGIVFVIVGWGVIFTCVNLRSRTMTLEECAAESDYYNNVWGPQQLLIEQALAKLTPQEREVLGYFTHA